MWVTRRITGVSGILPILLLLAACSTVGVQGRLDRSRLQYARTAQPISFSSLNLQRFEVSDRAPLSRDQGMALATRLMQYTGTALKLDVESVGRRDDELLFRAENDPSGKLSISLQSHDFLFNRGLREYKGDQDTPELLAEVEAVTAAKEHLRKLELLPGDGELVLARVGGVSLGVHRSDGATAVYRKLVTVRFDRKLAGLPVLGNSRLVLQLGERGKLVGFVWNWRPVGERALRKDELLGEVDVKESLERRLIVEAGSASRIIVQRTDLVLLDHGQGVIEPAIHVIARLIYDTRVRNGKTAGQARTYEVPYDSFEPIVRDPKTVYPFMRDPKASSLIKLDKAGRE